MYRTGAAAEQNTPPISLITCRSVRLLRRNSKQPSCTDSGPLERSFERDYTSIQVFTRPEAVVSNLRKMFSLKFCAVLLYLCQVAWSFPPNPWDESTTKCGYEVCNICTYVNKTHTHINYIIYKTKKHNREVY